MSRRVDASMDLLKAIRETALDPGYGALRGRRSILARAATVSVLVVLGVMMVISATDSGRATPQNAAERADMVARITAARQRQDALRAELAKLEDETQKLASSLVSDPRVRAGLDSLEPVVGAKAVRGPGVTITVDDAGGSVSASQLVTDRDMRQLVNGLWKAGAEAISINGHRLSTRTAIRSAGAAITVDYSSLVRPYVIHATGDPTKLPARFSQTPGGTWWSSLRTNYGLRFDVAPADSLSLPADPGLGVSKVRTQEEHR